MRNTILLSLLGISCTALMVCALPANAIEGQDTTPVFKKWLGFSIAKPVLETVEGIQDNQFSYSKIDKTTAKFQTNFKSVSLNLSFDHTAQDYQDTRIRDTNTYGITSGLLWDVSKKANLNLSFKRGFSDQNEVSDAFDLSKARLQLDYEFLHNLFYKAYLDYSLVSYETSKYQKDILRAGTQLKYQYTPEMSFSGDYNFSREDSSAINEEADAHEFMVRIHRKF